MHLIVPIYIFFIFTGEAKAYVDPGATGVILQFLATVFGLLLFYAKRIFRFFKRDKNQDASKNQNKSE